MVRAADAQLLTCYIYSYIVKLMTYAQRPTHHPMRAEKYVYDEMENCAETQAGERTEIESERAEKDKRNLCVGIRSPFVGNRQPTVLVVGLHSRMLYSIRYALSVLHKHI